MVKVKFKNDSDLEFKDISGETYREYSFGIDGHVYSVIINNPLKLHVSDNGHRIFGASGISHYVPLGWIDLKWEVSDGEANFSL